MSRHAAYASDTLCLQCMPACLACVCVCGLLQCHTSDHDHQMHAVMHALSLRPFISSLQGTHAAWWRSNGCWACMHMQRCASCSSWLGPGCPGWSSCTPLCHSSESEVKPSRVFVVIGLASDLAKLFIVLLQHCRQEPNLQGSLTQTSMLPGLQ